MTEISFREVMQEKFRRQAQIQKLQSHAHGTAIHIGKISPGCRVCFTGEQGKLGDGSGVFLGRACMSNCPMCYYNFEIPDETDEEMENTIQSFIERLKDPAYRPYNMAYVSEGETLLYLDKMRPIAEAFNRFEDQRGVKVYHHLYTNALLATPEVLDILVGFRIDELRVHVSASQFSDRVLQNMRSAKERGIVVSVEEPSWPLHRQALFDHLPVFEDIGISHLNLVEVQLSEFNRPRLERLYPQGQYYKDYFYHLYDEGLVYDIIEEVLQRNYSYSVLDCNSAIERSRNGAYQQDIGFDYDSIDGLLAPFDWESPRE